MAVNKKVSTIFCFWVRCCFVDICGQFCHINTNWMFDLCTLWTIQWMNLLLIYWHILSLSHRTFHFWEIWPKELDTTNSDSPLKMEDKTKDKTFGTFSQWNTHTLTTIGLPRNVENLNDDRNSNCTSCKFSFLEQTSSADLSGFPGFGTSGSLPGDMK